MRLNGVHQNGNGLNGYHANGAHTNGNGTGLNGSHANGNGTITNGSHTNGHHSDLEDHLPQPLVLPVSAASASSLKPLIEQIAQTIAQLGDEKTTKNLALTLTKGRDTLRHRSYLTATYDKSLGKYAPITAAEGPSSVGVDPPPFGFVFTGQGAQYAGMAKELLTQNPDFRDTIRGLDEILQRLPATHRPSWTLEQTLVDDAKISKINEVTRSQPICTAVQIALVDLLRNWGIQPTSVVGHSSGEIAAAYAAGLLNTEQAILVAYFRGYAVGQLKSIGGMMAAGLGPELAENLIQEKGLQGQVRVACVNAPQGVTLSGSPEAIQTLHDELQGQQKFVRKLETGGRAYHSHMMEEIGQLYEELLAPLFPNGKHAFDKTENEDENAKMYSSVGHNPDQLRIMDSQSMGASYWRQNLEQPVQFSSALSSLAIDNKKIHLIEIGPHSALKGPIQQIRKSIGFDEKAMPYAPTLVRKEDASLQILNLAGTLFTRGYSLAWGHVNGLAAGKKATILHSLAPYHWDYSGDLLWNEPRASIEMRNRKHIRHELLGTIELTGNSIDYHWRNILKPSEMPWIQDHKLEEQVVFPAAGYVAIALEAISQISGIKTELKDGRRDVGFELSNVNISAALNVPAENDKAGKDLELHTTMSLRKISGANTSTDWHDFSISSLYWTTGHSTVHCTGSIRITQRKTLDTTTTNVKDTNGFDLWASTAKWYSKWHEEGLCFGPQFQSLTTLRTDSAQKRHEAIATTRISPPLVGGTYEYYPVHPITIDAGLQAACLSGTSGHVASLKTWLPVFIAEAYIQPSTQPVTEAEGEIHVRSEEMGFSSRRIDGVSVQIS